MYFILVKIKGHKLGCINAVIASALVLGCESIDLIVFSHDDVQLVNNEKFKKCLDLINEYFEELCW